MSPAQTEVSTIETTMSQQPLKSIVKKKAVLSGTMPVLPQLEDKFELREYLKGRLVLAYRLAAKMGFDEGTSGHITIKDPVDPTCLWINPFGCNWNTLRASELLLVNSNGVVLNGGQSKLLGTAAFKIHHATHMARPDIVCAVHTHSLYGKAFSALGRKLEMQTQDSCAFFNDQGYQRAFTGSANTDEPAQACAKALGPYKLAILQNHGIMTVGNSVESAFFWYVSAETSCHAQLLADAAAAGRGGQPTIIDDKDAQHSYDSIGFEEAGWFNGRPMFDQMAIESGEEYLL